MEAAQVREPMLDAPIDSMLYEQLLDRQQRLRDAEFENLVAGRCFAFIGRSRRGTDAVQQGHVWSLRRVSRPDRAGTLIADPLIKLCLGDLTQKQLDAIQEDLQLAAEIQKRLLPKSNFSSEFLHADFAYQPAGIVSGDYVDLIPHDGELYFILGDVSGKGMAASILMSNLARDVSCARSARSPGLRSRRACEPSVCESTLANQYATLVVGKINANGEVEMCNAGHLPPIIVGGEKSVELGASGLPLGMFSDSSFISSGVRLNPGETLLLFHGRRDRSERQRWNGIRNRSSARIDKRIGGWKSD
jgi:sigma-B regulation protein RsbU (phosphoserine phosphatase)